MRKLIVVMVLAIVATGCSTDKIHSFMRQKPAPVTDFLPQKERLVRRPDTYPVHYTWMDKNAVAKAGFKHIYFAPFDISSLRKGNAYDEMRNKAYGKTIGKAFGLEKAIVSLGEYGRFIFNEVFKAHERETQLKVVNNPSLPHTAVVEFAITGFVPTRAEVEVVGTAGNFLLPGIGLVADYLAAGSIAIECRVRDSRTKKVVMMFADTEGEPQALLQFAKYTYISAAKFNLRRIAKYCVESCIVEDDSTLRRDFPFKFIVLPGDAKLKE